MVVYFKGLLQNTWKMLWSGKCTLLLYAMKLLYAFFKCCQQKCKTMFTLELSRFIFACGSTDFTCFEEDKRTIIISISKINNGCVNRIVINNIFNIYNLKIDSTNIFVSKHVDFSFTWRCLFFYYVLLLVGTQN